jgi:MbtH protein
MTNRRQHPPPLQDGTTMSNDATMYYTVRNDEGQYSIWPTAKTIPHGWTDVGLRGTKDECLARVRELWTDLRPKSLCAWMGE